MNFFLLLLVSSYAGSKEVLFLFKFHDFTFEETVAIYHKSLTDREIDFRLSKHLVMIYCFKSMIALSICYLPKHSHKSAQTHLHIYINTPRKLGGKYHS